HPRRNGERHSERRPRRPTDRCYRCDEPGHVARDSVAVPPGRECGPLRRQ
uniref:CCHC-type domain-containing protein n=1 Tax=Oreochromis niloticus TaxID=8128 RepID=A0A669BGT1_ORENI